MSFNIYCKKELANQKYENTCCEIAFLSAVIKSSAEIKRINNGFEVFIKTGIYDVYKTVQEILKTIYPFIQKIKVREINKNFSEKQYEIIIRKKEAKQILLDCKIIENDDKGQLIEKESFDKYLVSEKCCQKSYIKGVFIGCSTNNILITHNIYNKNNIKLSSGYKLQFRFNNERMANDFKDLLSKNEIYSKLSLSKKGYIVYMKNSESILDFLAYIDLKKCYMSLQNEIIFRQIRSNANRQSNCTAGNVSKTIKASFKQIEDIETIDRAIGIDSLDERLQDVALLRLANPEESLDDLVSLSSEGISKSGLNHRFRKIANIASKLGG